MFRADNYYYCYVCEDLLSYGLPIVIVFEVDGKCQLSNEQIELPLPIFFYIMTRWILDHTTVRLIYSAKNLCFSSLRARKYI